jgi:hypothetical protein
MGGGKIKNASATNIGVTVEIINGRVQNKTQNLYHLTPHISFIRLKIRSAVVMMHRIGQNSAKCQLRPSTRDFKN